MVQFRTQSVYVCPGYLKLSLKDLIETSVGSAGNKFKGERMVVVGECLWFWENIQHYQILLFSPKSFLVFSIL